MTNSKFSGGFSSAFVELKECYVESNDFIFQQFSFLNFFITFIKKIYNNVAILYHYPDTKQSYPNFRKEVGTLWPQKVINLNSLCHPSLSALRYFDLKYFRYGYKSINFYNKSRYWHIIVPHDWCRRIIIHFER